ncbi:zinc finger protein 232-like isoform X3 [Salvelinus fontinalis]|uniref:zinc finger protein 232-like isoform X3 n=1 Tax=Salvelinus fontinalis TaxID=8038 RepID=UPI00248621A9|nr:zinc finger protein 232-like isoform X3 [Salvelinus fontinalis]XP_055783076.1 zinc finger protein 232-like isoform X3 [Salvelinus fontinalis]XP_055783077.1 zinc finger protein 232-like isoform X3 [Salvelinus fontinalis]
MADSVETFQTHLTSVMDSLIRASVCEITKLFQDTVNDYLVEISLNRNEMEALKLRLRLTENKLRNERKYGMGWAENRRNAGLIGSEDGGRKKRKIEVPRGKQKLGPAFGGVWEEGGGAAGEVAGGGWKEARQMYLIQVPGEEEEDEGELLEEGCISGEGEETDIIKEESGDMVDGGYQPASLRLIKEALKMDPPNQNCHGSRTHSEVGDMELSPVALKRPPAVRPEEGDEEEWDVGSPPTEVSEGALSVVDLSGLETALRAERGREQAGLKIPPTAGSNHGSRTPDPVVVADREFRLGQKYIGLDGLEQKGELESPTASERDYGDALQVHGARLKELQGSLPMGAGGELQPRWPKRLRDGEGMGEQGGSDEGLHHLSAPGSVDDSGEEETGDLMHFCMQCGGGFANEAELEEHPCPLGDAHLQEGGTENTLFPCASCGHAFSHAWALKNHECVCAAERPHRCELCGKGFTHSRSLERHQVVHTGERQHCCQQCGRSFSRLGNLERHQRIHTGERPYGCEACGKRFSRVEYLKRHQLIHSGDRDKAGSTHQCSQCGKNFSEPEQLKNHECFS